MHTIEFRTGLDNESHPYKKTPNVVVGQWTRKTYRANSIEYNETSCKQNLPMEEQIQSKLNIAWLVAMRRGTETKHWCAHHNYA
eukprot:scaffold1511_cov354-Pavlova_lutheri.AAC.4